MKNIIFTIKTEYSTENYFLEVNENHSIELQIDNALAEICFCDEYEIVSYKEVSEDYTEERNTLLSEYEKLFNESIEDAFMSGKFTTLEAIKKDIDWRKNNK